MRLLPFALAAAATAVLLSGCESTVTGSAVRASNAGPNTADVPQLKEADLDRMSLNINDINEIVGADDLEFVQTLDEMSDHSDEVSDPDCLGSMYGAEDEVYKDAGWTAVRDEMASQADATDHWVQQTVVLYPSSDDATAFVDDSQKQWDGCAESTLDVNTGDSVFEWTFEDVEVVGAIVTQVANQTDADGWACQHALGAVSNVTAETWVCGFAVTDEAATMADDIIAKAAKK